MAFEDLVFSNFLRQQNMAKQQKAMDDERAANMLTNNMSLLTQRDKNARDERKTDAEEYAKFMTKDPTQKFDTVSGREGATLGFLKGKAERESAEASARAALAKELRGYASKRHQKGMELSNKRIIETSRRQGIEHKAYQDWLRQQEEQKAANTRAAEANTTRIEAAKIMAGPRYAEINRRVDEAKPGEPVLGYDPNEDWHPPKLEGDPDTPTGVTTEPGLDRYEAETQRIRAEKVGSPGRVSGRGVDAEVKPIIRWLKQKGKQSLIPGESETYNNAASLVERGYSPKDALRMAGALTPEELEKIMLGVTGPSAETETVGTGGVYSEDELNSVMGID